MYGTTQGKAAVAGAAAGGLAFGAWFAIIATIVLLLMALWLFIAKRRSRQDVGR